MSSHIGAFLSWGDGNKWLVHVRVCHEKVRSKFQARIQLLAKGWLSYELHRRHRLSILCRRDDPICVLVN